MADRTSAGIFSEIFDSLAKRNTPECREIAQEIWDLHWNYDFCNYQMDCNDALITLGLATDLGEGRVKYEGENEDG